MTIDKTIVSEKRIEYLDCLRIMATIAVIMIHVAARKWYSTDINSFQWLTMVMYDGVVRWAVPVFVMISGVVFCRDGKWDIAIIYKKYVARIIIAFIFWSLIYTINSGIKNGLDFEEWLISFFRGPYHMWYLYMIVGVYILIPFFKVIINSEILTRYFLLLSLFFTFIIPFVEKICSLQNMQIATLIEGGIGKLNFHFTLGYVSYFILGFYLNKINIDGKMKRLIYFGGIIGFLLTPVLTLQISWLKQMPDETFYDYFALNVLLESIAVFVFVKNNYYKLNITGIRKRLVEKLSKFTFGVYLVHVLVIDNLVINYLDFEIKKNGWESYPLITIPLITFLVAIISFGISALLNRISLLKNHIV